MYYVLHTSTCYYIVEQFYTYSHTIVASTYVLATIGFDANEKEPSKVCRQQHTNPTPWVMTSALETVHKFLCGRTVRNVDKCEALAVLGIFVRHVEEVVIIIAQPDVVKQPDHLVNTEPLRYWSFRALLPNSHASSQVDEYRKRIRKTGETAYLHSQLSVNLRVRITLELRKIYPERIECFNSIMLSGIRLCFSLWVAQMPLSSVIHENLLTFSVHM